MSVREVVSTEGAPGAIGPYSQAIVSGDLVFCSGQIALDPATGALVDGGVEAQAARALQNLTAVLAASGCSPADVVKTTVFVTDMGDFPAVNAVYARTFTDQPPARATVEVSGLPMGALVEVDAVARRPA